MTEFRETPPLKLNGAMFAEVSMNCKMVFLGEDYDECFNVEEVRQLRDWLTAALPADTEVPYIPTSGSGNNP